MYLFNYRDLSASAKQLGEQTYAIRLLREEVDDKYKNGIITISQWASDRIILDDMNKDLDEEYRYVYSEMNAIVFTTEHPEGETNKPLIRVYLKAAYPEDNPENFCIMQ